MAGNSSLTLKDFFGNSDYEKFEIPMYQRSYSWTNGQLDELWSDLENLDDEDNTTHFIGLFVMTEDESIKRRMQVVDGQQRITSVSILLAVLRDLMWEIVNYEQEVGKGKIAFTISTEIGALNKFLYAGNSNADTKLEPNENDKEAYRDTIAWLGDEDDARCAIFEKEIGKEPGERLTSEEIKIKNGPFIRKNKKHRMVKAYERFMDQVREKIKGLSPSEKVQQLFILQKKVLERLRVMTFVEDENGAFDLFESLNDRGLKLAAIDLIKNRVLRKVVSENRRVISERWDAIFGKDGILASEKQDLFLRAHWNSTEKFITKSDLYKSYKSRIEDAYSPMDFVSELEFSAESYAFLRDEAYRLFEMPQTDDLQKILRLLRKSGSYQWYSLALPLVRIIREEFDSENKNKYVIDEVRSTFWLILNVITRFLVLETRFNKIEKRFPEIAVKISQKYFGIKEEKSKIEFLKSVQQDIVKLFDEDVGGETLLKKTLKEKGFEGNDLAALLIEMATYTKLPHGSMVPVKLTLEHVLPIKHNEWGIPDEEAEAFKFKLGNMLVLEQPFNSSLQNSPFKKKKAEYEKENVSETFYPEDIQYWAVEDWNNELIRKRTDHISTLLSQMLEKKTFESFSKLA